MAECRVVIVEPSAVVAEGLRSILEGLSDMTVAAVLSEAGSAARLAAMSPDVVIINPLQADLRTGAQELRNAGSGLQGVAFIAMAWGCFDEELLKRFDGVISAWDNAAQIVRKVRSAARQEAGAPKSGGYELSEREREILVAVAKGLAN